MPIAKWLESKRWYRGRMTQSSWYPNCNRMIWYDDLIVGKMVIFAIGTVDTAIHSSNTFSRLRTPRFVVLTRGHLRATMKMAINAAISEDEIKGMLINQNWYQPLSETTHKIGVDPMSYAIFAAFIGFSRQCLCWLGSQVSVGSLSEVLYGRRHARLKTFQGLTSFLHKLNNK